MFSSKARYALKAALILAHHGAHEDGTGLMNIRDLAEAGSLPRPFLAKIMQELSAVGIVRARKGPGGGVALAHHLDKITIADLIFSVDMVEGTRRCLMEGRPCSEVRSCPLHTICKEIREDILGKTTLKDLLESSSGFFDASGPAAV